MTVRTAPRSLVDTRRPAHADVERLADAVVRTPELDPTLIRFLAGRVADYWSLPVEQIERRLAVRIAHRVAVRDTARLLRSA